MKIDFEFETEHGVFRDALHFADDAVPDAVEIEALKQQRLANWLAFLETMRLNAEAEAEAERAAAEAARAEALAAGNAKGA